MGAVSKNYFPAKMFVKDQNGVENRVIKILIAIFEAV